MAKDSKMVSETEKRKPRAYNSLITNSTKPSLTASIRDKTRQTNYHKSSIR